MKKIWHLLAGCGLLALPQPARSAALRQEAYVWQRAWTPEVREAVTNHSASFAGYVALAAEVAWRQGRPQIVRVPIDYSALRAAQCPSGLALRIGPFAGPFKADDATANTLIHLAVSLLAEARAAGVAPRELQIDFDCAEARLADYQIWVEACRRKIAPTPLIITTLPSWLRHSEFRALAAAADGFILQVHSLERPERFEADFTLCDPATARRAVAQAAQLGIPFRVALPTYGYLMAFAPDGHFLGLSAEGPARMWPPDTRVRELRADAPRLAELVREWSATTPANLGGIIWYRLPNSLDANNWPWPTLKAVMGGRIPREALRLESRRPEPALTELHLQNEGETEIRTRPGIKASWQQGRLIAGDGLREYTAVDLGNGQMSFRARTNAAVPPLAPGAVQTIGWLRFDREVEVHIEMEQHK